MATTLLVPRCCSDGNPQCAKEYAPLYAQVRTKPALDYKTRKALLSHWSPRIAKTIVKKCYPDFRGSYEQNLWLLTLTAANQADLYSTHTSLYTQEAREKNILFLWPYPNMEDTRLCGPSHYMYHILKWGNAEINAILTNSPRQSERLNIKYLIKALCLTKIYRELPSDASAANERRKALKAIVKTQMMLSAQNNSEFKIIAYGWTYLRNQRPFSMGTSKASQALAEIDAQIFRSLRR